MKKEIILLHRKKKLKVLFIILTIFIGIYLITSLAIVLDKKKISPKIATIEDTAIRGSIISADGYTLSRSQKSYRISVHAPSIDLNKMDLFLRLFSIYANIDYDTLISKIFNKRGEVKKGWVLLAKNVDAKRVIFLKQLKYKFNRLKVFVPTKEHPGIIYGLSIKEEGEKREYPLNQTLSPALGYTQRKSKNGLYLYPVGIKGLEKSYNYYLNSKEDGFLKGKRDVVGHLIFNGELIDKKRIDGLNLILNIDIRLQRATEAIADLMKKELNAKEVLAIIMESKSSKIVTMATSNRYDPGNIKKEDIPKLEPKFTSYTYEPGSVLKPIVLAIALENNITSLDRKYYTNNGKLRLGKYLIRDDEPFEYLNPVDIIVHSSNIGITKIAWEIDPIIYYKGIKSFGLGEKSGCDIGSENRGKIKTPKELRSKVSIATHSYGYGIHANMVQLLKAYNVFNNNGFSKAPLVVNYLQRGNKKYRLKRDKFTIHPISQSTALTLKNILEEVVLRGTATGAKYDGLEIGGKTGTAQIYEKGEYQKEYHTSFFGFVNDIKDNRYTIGILVIRPDYEHHFASQSSVVVFKKIVDAMVMLNYLKPKMNKALELKKKLKEEKLQKFKAKKRKIQKAKIKKALKKKAKEFRKKMKKLKKKRKKIKRRFIPPPPSDVDLF